MIALNWPKRRACGGTFWHLHGYDNQVKICRPCNDARIFELECARNELLPAVKEAGVQKYEAEQWRSSALKSANEKSIAEARADTAEYKLFLALKKVEELKSWGTAQHEALDNLTSCADDVQSRWGAPYPANQEECDEFGEWVYDLKASMNRGISALHMKNPGERDGE